MPWALLRFVGVPDLPSTSSIDQAAIQETWQAFIRDGRSDHAVVVVLAVVVWVAWLRIAIALVVEVVARLARRPVPRLPGLGHSQQLVASLLSSLLVATAMSAGTAGATGIPDLPRRSGRHRTRPPRRRWRSTMSPTQRPGDRQPLTSAAADVASVTVVRNDSWWRLAERHLGDGTRWQELAEANVGRLVAREWS
ncbi:MAG: LysM peptidoglycan-binding domain-containing protein [Ilumatobacteraceae bacterium]